VKAFGREDYNFLCGQQKFPKNWGHVIDGKKRTRDRKGHQRWKSNKTRSSTPLSDMSEEEIDVPDDENSDIDYSCSSRSTQT
jgi:hypothetical protein